MAEVHRRLLHVARVLGPCGLGANAGPQTEPDEGRDSPGLQMDALLELVERLTSELGKLAPGDAGELLLMQALLTDVSLVLAAFRWRVATVARQLSASAERLAEARRVVVASQERDGTGMS